MSSRAKTKKRHKTRKAIAITATLFVLCVVVGIFYGYGMDYYRKYYACPTIGIDANRYPVMGIDISSHQGEINWNLVKESGVKFCFIKATEGGDFFDKRYQDNYNKAKSRNIVVGAYHFFKFNRDGKLQAQNFINHVKLTDNDLPPVMDFEAGYGNRFTRATRNQVQKELLKCLREMEKKYHQKPIIYTNVETYNTYIKGSFDEYPLWLCKLCTEPSDAYTWTFWQYTHRGVVPGIKGNVDMNIFNGSYTDFVTYIYNARNKRDGTNLKLKRSVNSRKPDADSTGKKTIVKRTVRVKSIEYGTGK